jgi:hypothetical protein
MKRYLLHSVTKTKVLKLIYNVTVINPNNKNIFAGFKIRYKNQITIQAFGGSIHLIGK